MTITRRQFLAGGVAAAGAAALGRSPIEQALGMGADAAPAPASSGRGTLVLLALYGGNDGLNTVVPYHDAAYLHGRPTLGYQPGDVIPLDKDLALNPGLKGFKTLWDAKKLAIVRGVGYPDPSYSHFRSMDIWQTGAPDTVETTGWLGRWLDHVGGQDPLVALTVGPTVPRVLVGASAAGAAIPAGALRFPGPEARFAALSTPFAGEPPLAARAAQSGADLLSVLHQVQTALGPSPAGTGTAGSGETSGSGRAGGSGVAGSGVAQQLDLVARLIKGGLPTRVYVVSAGGFDTHFEEKATHARLMGEIDTAVTDFVHTMAGDPKGAGVVLMTFSEFGRRVAENASGGTDHGSAGPVFVTGPGVAGGYYGEEPSLTHLDNGNLRFTTDFRSVYATVADKVLGVDPGLVLYGRKYPTLGFV